MMNTARPNPLIESRSFLNTTGNQSTKINFHSANETKKTTNALKKAFVGMEDTLESMKNLAELALRQGISDEDRINLQIDMTKLQTKLFKSIYRLSLEIQPGVSSQKVEQSVNAINHTESYLLDFLQDAKQKIKNGEYTPGADGVDLSDLSILVGDSLTKITFKGGTPDRGYDAELLEQASGLTSTALYVGAAVTNIKTAQESVGRISEKLALIGDLKREFAEICEDGGNIAGDNGAFMGADLEFLPGGPLIQEYPLPTGNLARNSFNVSDGRDPADAQNYPGFADNVIFYDMRMQNPRNKREAFFQKADAIFKDKVFGALGFVRKGLDSAISKNKTSGRSVDLRI